MLTPLLDIDPPHKRFNTWDVYRQSKLVNSVTYTKDCDEEYVRKSLINHDGYHPDIYVRRRRKCEVHHL